MSKCKKCKKALRIQVNKKNYICSGDNKKPAFYKNDVINLCVSGQFCEQNLEMTPKEATFLICVLSMTLSHFQNLD